MKSDIFTSKQVSVLTHHSHFIIDAALPPLYPIERSLKGVVKWSKNKSVYGVWNCPNIVISFLPFPYLTVVSSPLTSDFFSSLYASFSLFPSEQEHQLLYFLTEIDGSTRWNATNRTTSKPFSSSENAIGMKNLTQCYRHVYRLNSIL